MKKIFSTVLVCFFALALFFESTNSIASPATGKTLNGQQLREGMIGQSKEQVRKWFGTPSRTNGRTWVYEGLIINDNESGTILNVMFVDFTSEEGGTVQKVSYVKSY